MLLAHILSHIILTCCYVAAQDTVLVVGGAEVDDQEDVHYNVGVYCPAPAENHSVCHEDIQIPQLPLNLTNAVGIYSERWGVIGES